MICSTFKKTIALQTLSLLVFAGCSKQNVAGNSCLKANPSQTVAAIDFPRLAQADSNDHFSLIIKVKNVASQINQLRQELVAAHESFAGTLGKIKIFGLTGELISLQIPKGSPAIPLIEQKIATQEILFAEPDYQTFLIQPGALSLFNDPGLAQQWAHQKMNTYGAWQITRGNSKVIVAVVDTGVDYTHKDLASSMWKNEKEILNGIDDDQNGYVDDIYGYDFVNNDADPMSDDAGTYHGTHVAGTIAASLDNQSGGAGVAPGVKIMALKYLDQFGSGSTSNAIRAIEYAIANGAKIINNSWGSMGRSQALQDSIEHARAKGILFVAAAGNGDYKGFGINLDLTPFYPAAFTNENVISVAASDASDSLAPWSNFGTHVDVAAPGVSIYSTRNGNTYASLSGTSMATPAVSGVLGLILSANPKLSAQEAKNILLSSVDPVASMKTKLLSGGRVNAAKAVQLASNTQVSGIVPVVGSSSDPSSTNPSSCIP